MKSEVFFLAQRNKKATDTATSTWDTCTFIKGTPPFVTANFMLKYIFECIAQEYY